MCKKEEMEEALRFLNEAKENILLSSSKEEQSMIDFKEYNEYLSRDSIKEALLGLKNIGIKYNGDSNFWRNLSFSAECLGLQKESEKYDAQSRLESSKYIEMPEDQRGLPLLDASSMGQASLIILRKSGIVYWNQTCNTACAQRGEEGVLLPLVSPSLNSSKDIYCPLEDSLSALDWGPIQGINEERANEIDVILQQFYETKSLNVDRTKLKESEEAWIYVNIDINSFKLGTEIKSNKGILVWINSD